MPNVSGENCQVIKKLLKVVKNALAASEFKIDCCTLSFF